MNDETVDVHAFNSDGETPLHLLCKNYKGDQFIELVDLLNADRPDLPRSDQNLIAISIKSFKQSIFLIGDHSTEKLSSADRDEIKSKSILSAKENFI